jgi:ankyrin repeat protein
LLDHGANVQAHDKSGRTALTVATEKGYTALIALLKNAGAR